jgi:hypothetical protein
VEFNVIINQAALRTWIERKQIDTDDAAIVAFIRHLSPNDPRVKKYMIGTRYRIQRSWLLKEMPILMFGEDRLSRRLHGLQKIGILDLKTTVNRDKQFLLYAKLTAQYFREEDKAREDLERKAHHHGENTHGESDHHGENTHGRSVRTPTVKTPTDHIKNDQGGANAAASLKRASGVAHHKQEISAEQLELKLAGLPWKPRKKGATT